MDNASKAWTARFLISLLPGMVAIAILSGYSISEALGEGYSTILYLVVISGAEVAAVYAFQSEEANAGDQLVNILLLIIAVVLWAAFVFYRVGAALDPTTLAFEKLLLVGAVSLIPMVIVFRSHHRIMGGSKTLSELERSRDKKTVELRENKPKEGKVGDKTIDVSS